MESTTNIIDKNWKALIKPNKLDIKTGKTFIEGVKRVNPKKIITYWRDNILMLYETEILDGEITFFVNKDYRNDIGTEVQTLKVLEDIRGLVRETTKENKEKAMKYLQNLTKLCKLYFSN